MAGEGDVSVPTMEVRARLTATTAQFVDGMKQATNATSQLLETAGRTGGLMRSVAVGLGAMVAAVGAFGEKSFMAAARVQEMDIALQAVGKATGLGYDKLQATTEAVKSMGIEMAIAQKSVMTMVQSNMDLAYASKLARASQDLAVISGKNSTDTFNQLIHAIQTQNSMALRNVGIVTTAKLAYEEYAKAHNVTVKSLTQVEQKQAMVNAVLKDAGKYAGVYEAAMNTPSKVLRSFPRLIDDVMVAVGKPLVDGFGPIIVHVYQMLKAFVNAIETSKNFKVVLDALGMVFSRIAQPILNVVDGITNFIKKLGDAKTPVDMVYNGIGMVDRASSKLAGTFNSVLPAIAAISAGLAALAGRSLLGMLPIVGRFASAIMPLPIALMTFALFSEKVRTALGHLFSAFAPLLSVFGQFTKGDNGVGMLTILTNALAKAIDWLASIVLKVTTFLKAHKAIISTVKDVVFVAIGAFVAYKTVMMAVAAVSAIVEASQIAMGAAISAVEVGLLGIFTPVEVIVGAIIALAVAFAVAWKSSEGFRNGVRSVINAVGKVVGQVFGFILNAIGQLILAFGNLIDVHTTFGKVVDRVIKFYWTIFMNMRIAVLVIIKDIIDGFSSLMNTHHFFGKIVATVLNFVIGAFVTLVGGVLKGIRSFIKGIVDLLEAHQQLQLFIGAVINVIIAIFKGLLTAIFAVVANILKALATLIHWFGNLYTFIKTVVKGIVSVFSMIGEGIWNAIKWVADKVDSFFSWIFNKIKGFATGAMNLLSKVPGMGGVANALKEMMGLNDTTKGFTDSATGVGAVGALANQTSNLAKKINEANLETISFTNSWGNYTEGVPGALSKMANGMMNFIAKIDSVAQDTAGQKIINGLMTGAKATVSVLDTLIKGVTTLGNLDVGTKVIDTMVAGVNLLSKGLGFAIDKMESLKQLGYTGIDFVLDQTSQKAIDAGNFLIGLSATIKSFTATDFFGNTSDALGQLMKSMKDALGFGDVLKTTPADNKGDTTKTNPNGALAGLLKSAEVMTKIKDAMAKGIDAIQTVINDLVKASSDFAKSLKDVIVNFAGLKGVQLPDGFIPQAKSLIENMQMRLDKAQQFAVQIAQLQSMNLDVGALKDIIDMGPVKGASIAASLLAGGLSAIQEVSKLQKAIEFTGAGIGMFGASTVYDSQIANAMAAKNSITDGTLSHTASGSNINIAQGAFQITVDASGLKDAKSIGDAVATAVQAKFDLLAKQLAAK